MIKKFIKKSISKKVIALVLNIRTMIFWYVAGKPVPPPHYIKQLTAKKYAKKYSIKILVETGTYLGDMVEAIKNNFSKIISIELDKNLYKKAALKFKKNKHISILHGNSGKILPEIISQLKEPVLFWLDGHYSGEITSKGELNTPILAELEAIFNHPIKNHVIMIDDARLFNGKNDYPTIDELLPRVNWSNNYLLENKNDIIRICRKP